MIRHKCLLSRVLLPSFSNTVTMTCCFTLGDMLESYFTGLLPRCRKSACRCTCRTAPRFDEGLPLPMNIPNSTQVAALMFNFCAGRQLRHGWFTPIQPPSRSEVPTLAALTFRVLASPRFSCGAISQRSRTCFRSGQATPGRQQF